MKAEGVKPDYRDAETLRYLYVEKKLSMREIAELLEKGQSTIWKWMNKHGINRRSMSEAKELYPKIPFSGNPDEKAYMMGLRTGDIHVRRFCEGGNVIVCGTSTTHRGLMRLVRMSTAGTDTTMNILFLTRERTDTNLA